MIFSTKDRLPCLRREFRPRAWAYLAGILDKLECHAITVGGVEDHVHILCNLSKKYASMKILEILKKDSSKWIKRQSRDLATFHWQDGYGLFGVSPSHFDLVRRYILSQEEHHRRVSFQEEFLRILKKYRVDYDERYLWD